MTFGVMILILLKLIKLIKYGVSLYWIPIMGVLLFTIALIRPKIYGGVF